MSRHARQPIEIGPDSFNYPHASPRPAIPSLPLVSSIATVPRLFDSFLSFLLSSSSLRFIFKRVGARVSDGCTSVGACDRYRLWTGNTERSYKISFHNTCVRSTQFTLLELGTVYEKNGSVSRNQEGGRKKKKVNAQRGDGLGLERKVE